MKKDLYLLLLFILSYACKNQGSAHAAKGPRNTVTYQLAKDWLQLPTSMLPTVRTAESRFLALKVGSLKSGRTIALEKCMLQDLTEAATIVGRFADTMTWLSTKRELFM